MNKNVFNTSIYNEISNIVENIISVKVEIFDWSYDANGNIKYQGNYYHCPQIPNILFLNLDNNTYSDNRHKYDWRNERERVYSIQALPYHISMWNLIKEWNGLIEPQEHSIISNWTNSVVYKSKDIKSLIDYYYAYGENQTWYID